jgi:hypothetical protein
LDCTMRAAIDEFASGRIASRVITKIDRCHRYFPHKEQTNDFEWLFLFIIQRNLPRGLLERLSKVTMITRSTRSTWKAKCRTDPNWHPKRKNSQIQKRTFTVKEEQELIAAICTISIDRSDSYSDQNFRMNALNFSIKQCRLFRSRLRTVRRRTE